MKKMKISMMLGALLLVFSVQAFAQEVLPEVTVTAVRYKYLTAVGQKDAAHPVKMLERRAAEYNVKSSEYYEDEYDDYFISFYIPDGQILAVYDKDGKLLRTAEKYKNVALPKEVSSSVANRFPNWVVSKDAYLVNYQEENNSVKKIYKLTLENGDKRMKVKMNEKGEFL